jgi:histidinol-phosphatase (PHP family)
MPTQPVLYEMHMHTPLCKHAVGDPEEYAAIAKLRGLKGIVVTCHNPTPDNYAPRVRMAPNEFPAYVELVARARHACEGQIDVRLGIESDYVPGMESYLEKFHASAQFHHVLGSVHPQVAEYQARYFTGDPVTYQKTYFSHLAMAAETKLFDTLSHPDLVKNCHPRRWNVDVVMDHIRTCLDRIAKSGVAMELNTSGIHKDIEEMNPGPAILKEIHARNIPVVVGADAHVPVRVAAEFEVAFDMLRDIGFTHVNIFLDRKRHAIPIAEARASLKPL